MFNQICSSDTHTNDTMSTKYRFCHLLCCHIQHRCESRFHSFLHLNIPILFSSSLNFCMQKLMITPTSGIGGLGLTSWPCRTREEMYINMKKAHSLWEGLTQFNTHASISISALPGKRKSSRYSIVHFQVILKEKHRC